MVRVGDWLTAGPWRLAAVAFLVIALPLFIVSERAASDARTRAVSDEFAAASSSAERDASLLGQRLQHLIAQSTAAGVRPVSGRATPMIVALEQRDVAELQRQVDYLGAIIGGPTVFRVTVLDADHRIVATSQAVSDLITEVVPNASPIWTSPDGLVAVWPLFGSGGTNTRPEIGSSPFMTIRTDLRAVDGSSIGTLGLGVNVLALADVLLERQPAQETYLVDREGRLLVRASKFATDPERFRSLSDADAVSAALRDAGAFQGTDPISGQPRFIASARVTNSDWRVLVASPTTVVDDLDNVLGQQRLLRGVLVVLLVGAAYVVGRASSLLRRQRQELAVANVKLAAATEAKSRFLAAVSHDLRTPLNAVIGFSDILLQRLFGDLTEKQDEYLRDIRGAGEHQLTLVNDLLDLSKIEAGRMELHPVEFSLRELLQQTQSVLTPLAQAKHQRLELDAQTDMPSIEQDPARLRQIVINLLSNAVKFTPDGGTVRTVAESHAGVFTVAVSDTGIGISAEDQARVFEEFQQVGASARSGQGTGLGLALVRGFVRMMGGTVTLRSVVGEGSTFSVTLPLRQPVTV